MKTFDERFLSVQAKAKARLKKRAIISASVTSAFVVALLLVLFVPYSTTPPSVGKYADSPYYALIEKLNDYTYERPRYKNNFEALMASFRGSGDLSYSGGVSNAPNQQAPVVDQEGIFDYPDIEPESDPSYSAGNGSYEEVTDNQVAGVTEADIFKRSDKYIFHLMGNLLDIYTIAGEASGQVSRTNFTDLMQGVLPNKEDAEVLTSSVFSPAEMYLSEDCKTATVIGSVWMVEKRSTGASREFNGTVIVNVDVSNPEKVVLKEKKLFVGSLLSSRLVDGELLLTYRHTNYKNTIDYSDPESFVPRYGWFDALSCIPAEDILLPAEASDANYTVVAKLGSDLSVQGIKALLSYSQQMYVSKDAVYLTCSYLDGIQENIYGSYAGKQMTQITGISYRGHQLEVLGSVTIEGRVRDQYSMDAYEGIFRVVTTTVERRVDVSLDSTHYYPSTTNASLYCIDLESWQIVGSVQKFAPEGEEAMSVRFDGESAYVCTAEVIELTDPVYFFDLSDPKNITWTDTGTIDGYSSSLIQFGNGNLLGIGFNENGELKIEVYREGNGKVESVYSYERDCSFSGIYKSYFVDRENQLIGLGISDWNNSENSYLLLRFNGQSLVTVTEIPGLSWNMSMYRADMIDGWLYLLTNKLDVYEVDV